jgi:hypothetical protein
MMNQEEKLQTVRLAQAGGRYGEMSKYMKDYMLMNKTLNAEENELLQDAFDKQVESRRDAWIAVAAAETDVEPSLLSTTQKYRQRIEDEILKLCQDQIDVIADDLLENCDSSLSKVLYYSMIAKYHGYAAEVQLGQDREESIKAAQKSYVAAKAVACADLVAENSTRIKLFLDMACFTRNLLGENAAATAIAQQAFEEASKNVIDQDNVKPAIKDALRELQDFVALMDLSSV